MKYKAVIFDLDGTLLNSLVGIADAMNRLLADMGYPPHLLDSYKYFVGEGIRTLVEKAMPDQWRSRYQTAGELNAALDRLASDYRGIYEQTWRGKSDPYKGIPELLDRLCLRNIKIAVLSNKLDDFTKRMVMELLPRWRFEAVLGTRTGVPKKPAPESSLEIAALMALEPREIVFLGDTMVDMQTALNAGMYPVGACWGYRTRDELNENGAKALIRHPLELMKIIEI